MSYCSSLPEYKRSADGGKLTAPQSEKLMVMSATDYTPSLDLETTFGFDGGAARKRLLLIVNPYATTVSARLKNLVVSALRGGYIVDAVDTERRDHATELCREAASEGYDAIVAFGGDGTANEAANGLAGTGTPLTCLPGGRANVYCRILGIPPDVIDATEHLLALAGDWHPRAVDLGTADGRHFLFSAGVGLDARVVQQVDAHPKLKARLGEYYYAWVAAATFSRRYLLHPPRFAATFGGVPALQETGVEGVEGVTALIQNASPYTYFGNRGVEMAEGASLTTGDLAGLILKRTSPLDIPSITWRALSSKAKVADHRQVEAFTAEREVTLRSLDERELPLQLDGDFIGSAHEHTFTAAPGALTVIA